ncbi:MAG: hypothetical protein JNM07_05945 [Phycisphaerae bacterium]|nr:hypothetical protein [Phycisphaerae bacterium]
MFIVPGRDLDGPVDLRAEDFVLGLHVLDLAAQVCLGRLGKDIILAAKEVLHHPNRRGLGVGAGERLQNRATSRLSRAHPAILARPTLRSGLNQSSA